MFWSLLYDHPQGSSFVLSALPLLRLFASSRCLFRMWLYVVYVCVCPMYLSVGCLVVRCVGVCCLCMCVCPMYLSVGCLVVRYVAVYCLCMCVCPMYLSVGCLVVNDQTSHRQVHRAHTHIDNIQPHTE
jgi:hypothetical protein